MDHQNLQLLGFLGRFDDFLENRYQGSMKTSGTILTPFLSNFSRFIHPLRWRREPAFCSPEILTAIFLNLGLGADVSWDRPGHVILVATVYSTVQLEAEIFAASARRSIHLELWKQGLGSLTLVIYEPPRICSRNPEKTALKNEKDTIESESNLQFGFSTSEFSGVYKVLLCLEWFPCSSFFCVLYRHLEFGELGMMFVPFPRPSYEPLIHRIPNPSQLPSPSKWGLEAL